ncbi:GNAT family acetyltransferase [Clostridium carboxidivorans P7]|uniref:DUF2442 domain-containing protein n=1 Tax=Clostridium carboxidivorans P7 TaxID=536227 RepID=C6PMR6_9CLOT|nr:DUF2442 domain-containing protein [Clostridium carboxidivorans]AKN29845.1 GNAT family acetyltransferase [Clostridium carboxidivorans P7]EET89494.1 hypothetical protein CcarbDRAFT_0083 [Clostridium carboxidivorans P7]
MRILKVTPNDDYSILIEFEGGDNILFNMQRLVNTIRYSSLKDIERFKNIRIEDKTIFWQEVDSSKENMMPIMLTLDNILFALRD